MLKLYGGPRTRGSLVQWYLEELGVEYELVALNLQAGEHKAPEYLAINPMGKVPAIVDGSLTLWESGAILLYIAEKYGQLATIEDRSVMNQWILFANSTLGPGLVGEATRDRALTGLVAPLNQILEQHSFLTGESFTVADVAVGSILSYMPMMFGVSFKDYPSVMEYVKRLSERPAFQKTIGARV